ncbi:MAG: 30S ribosomal protein S20 [Micavibrio aeruginosavorus]|uniref:Small ribosomal subunit protein bS20 n=1 Tax=Micavibrio aeruginosavorus TaxID=349221 RepID=A0A2W5MZM5_9BACT|nr:MAG: 30S ribosomal protein S20 [Micavibrio aeruginosavorus]
MANHASAKKRIRTNARRNEINTARTSRIRTFLKKVEAAISGGDAKAAAEAFKAVQPELMRGVSKNIIEKNTAARKMSRLNARIKAMVKSA